MTTDKQLFGLTRAQLDEEDRQNLAASLYRHEDGPSPFYLDCPRDAIEDVARSLTEDRVILFLWRYKVIKIGQREWRLDGRLKLWRRAKEDARLFWEQGLLITCPCQGGFAYAYRKRQSLWNLS